ncbi:MAG: hypothetical protein N2Z67_09770 [Acetobacteraceae bacterium]|nr:hypothetical protein [Acetobacteraceae bacterium]
MTDAAGAPLDLACASARLQPRPVADGSLIASAGTQDGRLIIHGPAGRVSTAMPAAVMAGVLPGHYRFDREVTLPGGLRRTVERAVLLVQEDIARD